MGARPEVPDNIKRELTEQANAFLERKFRPGINKESAEKHGFNYIVDLYTKWWSNYFYLCAKYRRPQPGAQEEFFDVRTTRLEYTGNGRFNLAYMRHTGRWHEVFQGLTIDESLDTIEEQEVFWPMT